MAKLSLKDLDLKGKRALMRVDFNVPQDKSGLIMDDSRIRASLPSIEYVLEKGASLILLSHLGRPKGKDPRLSLAPCAKRLSSLLGKPVLMAPDCVGAEVEKMVAQLKSRDILMLENVRFHLGEEEPEKQPDFVRLLAKLGDLYINDAFGTAHRAHASTALIAKYFPHKAAAGFLMEKEIHALHSLLESPSRPFFAILGGAKVSTKAGVIHHLLKLVDGIFIGGAMTYTFLKAQGIPIGDSLCEESEVHTAREILANAKAIHLPSDLIIANAFAEDAAVQTISAAQGIPPGWQGMDIGPDTAIQWSSILKRAATVFWNGPLGVYEMTRFAQGTRAIAETLAHAESEVIVGGGDSLAAIQQFGLTDHFAHLSTGGGASLEFLEYGHLPGIDALSNLD